MMNRRRTDVLYTKQNCAASVLRCLVAATTLSQFRTRILTLRHMETVADKNEGSNVNFPQKCDFILPKNIAG